MRRKKKDAEFCLDDVVNNNPFCERGCLYLEAANQPATRNDEDIISSFEEVKKEINNDQTIL